MNETLYELITAALRDERKRFEDDIELVDAFDCAVWAMGDMLQATDKHFDYVRFQKDIGIA